MIITEKSVTTKDACLLLAWYERGMFALSLHSNLSFLAPFKSSFLWRTGAAYVSVPLACSRPACDTSTHSSFGAAGDGAGKYWPKQRRKQGCHHHGSTVQLLPQQTGHPQPTPDRVNTVSISARTVDSQLQQLPPSSDSGTAFLHHLLHPISCRSGAPVRLILGKRRQAMYPRVTFICRQRRRTSTRRQLSS